MTRLQIYLPEKMFFDLKRLASLRDKPMVALIREGLKAVLYAGPERSGKPFDPMRDFVGRAKTRPKTDAVAAVSEYYDKGVTP